MKYYPVGLNIQDRNCLVVGGGRVGARKAETLARCRARVKVVSPCFDETLWNHLVSTVELVKREYLPQDLKGMFLVVGATDNRQLNKTIGKQARQAGILFNGADLPELSDFIVPAVVKRGDLTIAVSTSGNSPAFAKKIKHQLEGRFGPEYERFLSLMGKIRQNLLAREHAPGSHKKIFKQLIDSQLLDRMRENDQEAIERLVVDILGNRHGVETLFQEKNK
ncbi:CysG [Desulforapulum autotrophicum HRM2]|uniref:precorrin-2 dehydrogenase n=1 Tax=Desulforapulum autotrophicum (strain ATCC 43914 / DSM 3382 / VKM B-1955 / HRM2) TaxID=177437 RepID=C0QLB5_DESAH|nr:bifunctional precorrin-2 dehydrogenase/sirohydrochlorin ferrochelatase [Desulforapulum autotrophicum]ACN14201.1 CysG [Desulforapulum autotrophicum HRM2]